jgi:hypothetical protein
VLANQIEIFFSILYRRLLKHGIFTSENDLAQQILTFIETYNQTAKRSNGPIPARCWRHDTTIGTKLPG